MAYLMNTLSEEEIKKLTPSKVKLEYFKLAEKYNKIIGQKLLLCPVCGEWKNVGGFYSDSRFITGLFYECKECLKLEAEQRRNRNEESNETVESVQKVLKKMDLPYIDTLYKSTKANIENNTGERNKTSIFANYITQLKSLPQYRNRQRWEHSEFGTDDISTISETLRDSRRNQATIKHAKKRFGIYFSNEELFWLENEYQDWIARYPCDSKAQELLFQTLCKQELERESLRIHKKSTDKLDKAIQDTMAALKIKPSQSVSDSLADTLTFGQLIEKWEAEKPVPEPDEQFKDVDHVGTYIDVFFKGHLAKMMGLRNAFSTLYDKYMEKYRVRKPEVNEEDEEALFNQIFGDGLDKDRGTT